MKLSVSIPDDLWEAARKRAGDKNSSQIIQEALRRLLEERNVIRSNLAGQEKLVSDERFAEALDAVRAAYQAEYRRGYEAGIECVRRFGFQALQEARQCDFDLDAATEWLGMPEMLIVPTAGADRSWFDDFEAVVTRNEVFGEGAARAFEDLWNALRAEDEPVSDASDPAEPEE